MIDFYLAIAFRKLIDKSLFFMDPPRQTGGLPDGRRSPPMDICINKGKPVGNKGKNNLSTFINHT